MKFFFIIFVLIRQCDGKHYEKLESKFLKGTPSLKFSRVTLLNCISRCALNNFHTVNTNADEHNEGDCHCFTDLYETEEKSKWTIMHVHKERKPLISEKQATRITDGEKKFCLEPESGECNPSDNTPIVYRKLSSHCLTDASVFIYDSDHGSITHACSGKRACFLGTLTTSSKLVLQKSCPDNSLDSAAWRTMFGSVQYGFELCLFPEAYPIIDDTKVSLTTSCMSPRAKFIFPEYGVEAKVKMQYYKLMLGWQHLGSYTSIADFPDNPIEEGYVDNMFTSPSNLDDYYEARLTAYFLPPQTGNYTFALTADDHAQLFIGNEPGVAGKTNTQKIIKVWGLKRYNSRFGFEDIPYQQKSLSIFLEKGKRYFLEAILAETNGWDYLTVAVHLPNGTFIKPITAQYLDRV